MLSQIWESTHFQIGLRGILKTMKKQIMAKILAVIIVMTFVPSNVFATEPQGDAEFNYVYEDGVLTSKTVKKQKLS